MTTNELTTDAILDAFATVGNVLPRAAMKQAADRWPEVGPALLTTLGAVADGGEISERTDGILFLGIYLMAQMRETRAFPLLCTIAADRERIEQLIGDGITGDFSIILARTYDGDLALLRRLIEDANADEFVRDAGLGALAWLTVTGRIEREETARYLRDLHATLQPQDECWVWVGWQQAIAVLNLKDLVPLVEDAFTRGWIGDHVMSVRHFHEDLRAAQQASDPTEVFEKNIKDDGRFDDAAAFLASWPGFRQEKKPMLSSRPTPVVRPGDAPIRNPYRGVGRNDPCPCGCGKKYKKCCLDKVG